MAGLRNWWAGDRRSALTDFPELKSLDFSELISLDFPELISLDFIPPSAFQRLWSGTNLLFLALGCTVHTPKVLNGGLITFLRECHVPIKVFFTKIGFAQSNT